MARKSICCLPRGGSSGTSTPSSKKKNTRKTRSATIDSRSKNTLVGSSAFPGGTRNFVPSFLRHNCIRKVYQMKYSHAKPDRALLFLELEFLPAVGSLLQLPCKEFALIRSEPSAFIVAIYHWQRYSRGVVLSIDVRSKKKINIRASFSNSLMVSCISLGCTI